MISYLLHAYIYEHALIVNVVFASKCQDDKKGPGKLIRKAFVHSEGI